MRFAIGKLGALAACLMCGVASAQGMNDCAAPASPTADAPEKVRTLEHGLGPAVVSATSPNASIPERMSFYGVPGVSVAIIHEGKLEWAGGWGFRDVASCEPVTPETVFQAASISKTVAAVATLRLAERGVVDLDADINTALHSWKLPEDSRYAGTVNLRQLLSHSAGVSVHGFAGYEQEGPLPTLVQILNGTKPANSAAVRREKPAGVQFQYSGGGYEIVQQLLSDVTGKDYAALVQHEVFDPIGMTHSSVGPVLPEALAADHAQAHDSGRVIPGGWKRYPELAAAAVWTTPSDLARLLMDLQAARAGAAGQHALYAVTAQRMLSAQIPAGAGASWGLGVILTGEGHDQMFGHDGGNQGFESRMLAYVERGEGIVVLTNATRGHLLAEEIIRAAAEAYGWKALAGRHVEPVTVASATLDQYVGFYSAGPLQVWVERNGDALQARVAGAAIEPLLALSPTRFISTVTGSVAEFELGTDGAVTDMRIVEGGPAMTLARGTPPSSPLGAAPIFLRGTMNDWDPVTGLAADGDGYSVKLALAAGTHQFKIASADWHTVDLGVAGGTLPITETVDALPLVTRGANLSFVVREAGTFEFSVHPGKSGEAELRVRRVSK